MALALMLALLALAGCSRIKAAEGGSGSVVYGDTLFAGTRDGRLIALDKLSGETIWRFDLQGEEEDERAIYGTPAVSEDTIFFGGYDSILYAVTLNGDEQWIERVDGPIVGGVVIADGLVVVGSEVADPFDGNEGMVYAFDAITGDRKWKFPVEGKVWSTPAISDGLVIFGSLDHWVYAVSLDDGEFEWRFETGGAVAASPAVSDGRVYIGSFDGDFYALSTADGAEAWRYEGAGNWFWAKALLAEGSVYAPSLDGNMYALRADSGELLWKLETENAIAGTPVVVQSDLIVVPSNDGRLRVASLGDGILQDSCNVDEEIRTSLVEQDGVVYFGAKNSSIWAVSISINGNPDEEWVHFTDKDNPLPGDRVRAC